MYVGCIGYDGLAGYVTNIGYARCLGYCGYVRYDGYVGFYVYFRCDTILCIYQICMIFEISSINGYFIHDKCFGLDGHVGFLDYKGYIR